MGSTWKVISQIPTQVPRGGLYVDGHDLTIELGDNSQLIVEVDADQYADVTGLKAMIQAAVDLHDTVAQLKGP